MVSLLLFLSLTTPEAQAESRANFACHPKKEKWLFSKAIRKEWQTKYQEFQKNRMSDVAGFAEALMMRGSSFNVEEKAFAEFWVSRALYDANLTHIAFNGWTVIAKRPLIKPTLGVQMAALRCLVEIQTKYPAFTIHPSIIHQAVNYPPFREGLAKSPYRHVLYPALVSFVSQQVGQTSPDYASIKKAMTLLQGSGSWLHFAQSLVSVRKNDSKGVVSNLRKYFARPRPRDLVRHESMARLLFARALYELEQYKDSAKMFSKVSKSSNELSHSLQDLAWAFLQARQYTDAIGTGISIEVSNLKKTFTPEAPLVMAISLNEICQYPDSIKAIDLFRENYRDSFIWLSKWKKGKFKKTPLYNQVVNYLKGNNSTQVPDKVASEWTRSPLFLARQGEINLLFKENKATGVLGRAGAAEQKAMAKSLLKFIRTFKKKYQLAKINLGPGEELPTSIQRAMPELRRRIANYRRFTQAAPFWRTILNNHNSQVPRLKSSLIASVNADLGRANLLMLKQLDFAAENTHLVEVEIYNGASQDIIWQNAHPDYKKVAKQMEAKRKAAAAQRVWDWGNLSLGGKEDTEIWEDELGSFKANLFDNCSNKERYLALER